MKLVEGQVEIAFHNRSVEGKGEYVLKLWVQGAFKEMACYRIQDLQRGENGALQVIVALKTDVLPQAERAAVEGATEAAVLRTFIEQMFSAEGTCRCLNDPKLRNG